jgi:predicted neuraminidase
LAALPSGDLLCTWFAGSAEGPGNDPDAILWPRVRYPLTVALSEDQGLTWPYRRHVDPGDGFCGEANEQLNRRCAYPAILQTADGAIHIAYSYRDRQCCKYVRVDEAWIRTGLGTVYGGPGE